jgi:hypothetical protein
MRGLTNGEQMASQLSSRDDSVSMPVLCPQRDFSIADAVATAVGYGEQRFTPANFS